MIYLTEKETPYSAFMGGIGKKFYKKILKQE